MCDLPERILGLRAAFATLKCIAEKNSLLTIEPGCSMRRKPWSNGEPKTYRQFRIGRAGDSFNLPRSKQPLAVLNHWLCFHGVLLVWKPAGDITALEVGQPERVSPVLMDILADIPRMTPGPRSRFPDGALRPQKYNRC